MHQGDEDDGGLALGPLDLVDALHRVHRLLHAVDEGQADAVRLHVELREDGIAEGFRGDSRSVRDEKDRSVGHVSGFKT